MMLPNTMRMTPSREKENVHRSSAELVVGRHIHICPLRSQVAVCGQQYGVAEPVVLLPQQVPSFPCHAVPHCVVGDAQHPSHVPLADAMQEYVEESVFFTQEDSTGQQ